MLPVSLSLDPPAAPLAPLASRPFEHHAVVDPDAVSEPSSTQSSSDASIPRLRLQNGASVLVKLQQSVCRDLLFGDFTVEAWFRIEVHIMSYHACDAWIPGTLVKATSTAANIHFRLSHGISSIQRWRHRNTTHV